MQSHGFEPAWNPKGLFLFLDFGGGKDQPQKAHQGTRIFLDETQKTLLDVQDSEMFWLIGVLFFIEATFHLESTDSF